MLAQPVSQDDRRWFCVCDRCRFAVAAETSDVAVLDALRYGFAVTADASVHAICLGCREELAGLPRSAPKATRAPLRSV